MIEVWRGATLLNDARTAEGLFRLRHDVFCARLNWVSPSHDGQERDRFDDAGLDPVYLLAKTRESELVGGVRLLPTVGPHMLTDVFSNISIADRISRSPAIREASRFVFRKGMYAAPAERPAAMLLQGMCQYGLASGIGAYLVVVTPAMHELVTALGAQTEIIGEGRQGDSERLLALYCVVSKSVLRNLRKTTGHMNVLSISSWQKGNLTHAA